MRTTLAHQNLLGNERAALLITYKCVNLGNNICIMQCKSSWSQPQMVVFGWSISICMIFNGLYIDIHVPDTHNKVTQRPLHRNIAEM